MDPRKVPYDTFSGIASVLAEHRAPIIPLDDVNVTPTARRRLGHIAVCAWVVATSGCGSNPVTADRLERAVESTFANLVQVQVARLDIAPIARSALDVTAACRPSSGGTRGAGEWTCRVRWFGPDRQPLRDTFDVVVTTDACYTATAEGDQLGGPALKTAAGNEIRNLSVMCSRAVSIRRDRVARRLVRCSH